MKKHLLILAVAAFSLSISTAKAQIISASEDAMETWHTDPVNPGANDPNSGSPGVPSWQCLNPLSGAITGASPVSTFEENTIVHGGSHSCKLTSVQLTTSSYAYVKSFLKHDTCGLVMSGTITAAPAFKLGVPFAGGRITQFSFWYQYFPATGAGKPDTASCSVVLTHYTGTTNIIGQGQLLMNSAGSWTHGTVNITYSMAGSPDTIIVVFSSSSYYKPVPGSILYIDDITTPAGINEVNGAATQVDVYPNPASTEVNFRVTGENTHSLEVFDITGKKVNTYAVKDNEASVNTASYPAGLYLYQLKDKDGNMVKVGKFSVAR
jgi:hypothetical protein